MFRYLILIALVLPALSARATPGITRGPYLQCATPDSIQLVWRTRSEIIPVVRCGAAPDNLGRIITGEAITVRRTTAAGGSSNNAPPLSAAPENTRQFEVKISGLEPDTKYYYDICDGGAALTPPDGECFFRTLPPPGTERPLLLWVVGDSGMGNKVQGKVHTAMRAWLKNDGRDLDGYLHLGDMAYGSGLDSEFQGFFFESYAATLKNTVCWPAFGNHEGRSSKSITSTGPYFDAYITPAGGESGGVPSGHEAYYSFDAGRVHFISLNSFDTSRRPDGAMAQWLKADLEKTKADWLICFFHHPPYTKGSHDSDDKKKDRELVEMREFIMPILESGGVDLVLAGHSHIYERSMLIDGAYATPSTAANVVLDDGPGTPESPYRKSNGLSAHQGTVAIVAGHGGASMSRKKLPHPLMRTTWLEFGSLLLDLKGDSVTGTMLNSEGVVRDTFQLVKQGRIELTRVANPRAPDPLSGPASNPPRRERRSRGSGLGVKLPADYTEVIPRGTEWQYLAGYVPPDDWTTSVAITGGWKSGAAGFGYSDKDDATEIESMKGNYQYLCIRREFELSGDENLANLGLAISFDDGFICYLNGSEVIRANVESGSLTTARGVISHEADRNYRFFPLGMHRDVLRKGKNILALEGHNDDIGSSDFSLAPALVITKETVPAVAAPPSSND